MEPREIHGTEATTERRFKARKQEFNPTQLKWEFGQQWQQPKYIQNFWMKKGHFDQEMRPLTIVLRQDSKHHDAHDSLAFHPCVCLTLTETYRNFEVPTGIPPAKWSKWQRVHTIKWCSYGATWVVHCGGLGFQWPKVEILFAADPLNSSSGYKWIDFTIVFSGPHITTSMGINSP